MKVCDLTCLYYPHGGGIKTYINNKRLVYKKRKINHILIAPNAENPKKLEKLQEGSLITYFVPCFNISLLGTPYSIFRSFKYITDIIRKEKPEVIEIGDKITTLLFKNKIKKLHQYTKAKIFGFSHERADNFAQTVLGNKFIGSLFANFFTKRFIKSVDVVLSNSDFTASEILKYLPKQKVFVVPLGICIFDFQKENYYNKQLYQQLSESGKKTLLIHVGRLDKDKKIQLLVEFARCLDTTKYKLIVAGGGAVEDDLKKIPAVNLIGYISHEEVKKYLAVSQLGILVNDIEPYGLVGLEMMSMGLAILGPKNGGLTTFLKKDFAWLLSYNRDEYLQALKEWQELSAAEKKRKSCLARQEAEKYSLDNMVDQLFKIYQHYG